MNLSQFGLEGKTALITGGSRGIGRETALAFANAGADVAVTSRKLPDLEVVADEVRQLGQKALAIDAHVGRIDQLQPLVDRVVAEFGRIDVLVNNAGTSFYTTSLDMTPDGWDAVMNLDLKGLFFLSQACARVMKERGGGRIINISSTAGVKAQHTTPHYSIAKAGVIMATEVMALEWAEYNIRVNCIAPGATKTRLWDAMFGLMSEDQARESEQAAAGRIPLKRVGDPRETANAILFLASDASSYVTGQSFAVDGGQLLR